MQELICKASSQQKIADGFGYLNQQLHVQAEEMLEAANMPLLKVTVPPEVRRIAEEEKDLTHSPGSSTVVSTACSRSRLLLQMLKTSCAYLWSMRTPWILRQILIACISHRATAIFASGWLKIQHAD